jgi:hypothetical protein
MGVGDGLFGGVEEDGFEVAGGGLDGPVLLDGEFSGEGAGGGLVGVVEELL